jgi:hypothetical protein
LRYKFCPKIIDLIVGAGTSRDIDSRQQVLEELYQAVDDTECLWLGKFVQLGVIVRDELMNSALISGFDNNIQCVRTYNPESKGTNISVFNICSTNENSGLVQQLFREELLSHSSYLESNRGIVGEIIVTKPALMSVVFDIRPEFFTFIGSCERAFIDQVLQGKFEGPDMFLKRGGIEIGDWIWGNCNPLDTAIVSYIIERKQLNRVKTKTGLYAIHLCALELRDNMSARPHRMQDLLGVGADPNLLTAENVPRSPLQCLMNSVVHPNQHKAIQTLLCAGADSSRITSDQHRRILARVRWTQCVRPFVLGLSDPTSLICNGSYYNHIIEVFYKFFVEHNIFP